MNAGETKRVTIKGRFPIQSMYENYHLYGPPQDDTNKATIALCVRSMDFGGKKRDSVWQLGDITVNSARVVEWNNHFDSFSVFDERHPSSTQCMLAVDMMASMGALKP